MCLQYLVNNRLERGLLRFDNQILCNTTYSRKPPYINGLMSEITRVPETSIVGVSSSFTFSKVVIVAAIGLLYGNNKLETRSSRLV